jgi:hypothetical protein
MKPGSILEELSIQTDKRALADLGLKMPKLTPKYWGAVRILAAHQSVSTFFIHLEASNFGVKRLYRKLAQLKFEWYDKRWVKTHIARILRKTEKG